jgi:DNA repair protein RadC
MVLPEIKISVTMDKKVKTSELFTIVNSRDAANLLRRIFNADTFLWYEEFIILCLNRSNKVMGYRKISTGGITGTVADPKIILTTALNLAATSIILAHNHPSGNLKPSMADEDLTKKIKSAAAYLDIKVLEHIILTDDSYYSFADEGLM